VRFSESYLRVLKERASIVAYAGTKMAWDKRKSNPGRGDYWACCPFHGEKSASFHVMEDKGAYKCFGCSEAGGTLDLVMKLEGLNFPEAVERLAEFAGVPLPEEPKSAALDAEHRLRQRALAAASAAQALFAETLKSPAGAAARDYLKGRGLGPAEWERFGIGLAHDGWQTCLDALKSKGFSLEEQTAAGLARPPQDGKRAISIFRNRITFRIDDAQGRAIAFGARALEKNAQAKYINSPESLIFHKGQTLYRLKQAREALARAKNRQGLVVAEGYLDVIALERAGVPAVAPLGTAITEEQLTLLWKAGPEPIFCLDGDAAGQRAAARVLDLALPRLGPDHTLAVVTLPNNEDPDDLFRRAGPEALVQAIAAAVPAVEALFSREAALKPLTTPEAKAGLKARLKKAAGAIADEETKRLYLKDLLDRAHALLRPAQKTFTPRPPRPDRLPPRGKGQKGRDFAPFGPPPGPTTELKAAIAKPVTRDHERLLGACIDYPDLCADHAEVLADLSFPAETLSAIRDQLLSAVAEGVFMDRMTLHQRMARIGLVDAATIVTHLPPLISERSETVKDSQAEAARAALLAEARQTPAEMKAPGATRERVARRASAKQALQAAPSGPDEAVRIQFAQLAHELYARANRAREEDEPAEPRSDADDDQFARAQALHFDRLRAARALAERTEGGGG
jgi:DNA primase